MMKKKIYIMSVILMLVSAALVFPVNAAGISITAPSEAPVGETLTIKVLTDSSPVSSAFVQFVPNNGIPVYAYTNTAGEAIYKPLVMGSVEVRASYEGQIATPKYITITTPAIGPTVNDTEITSGTVKVTGNVTINGTEITITTTPENATQVADQINTTGKISYDLPPEFEGATLDVDLTVTSVNTTTGEVTATATKKTLNNPPKTVGDFTIDCDIEFPGDFTPENMTFSITPPDMLNETVTEDIRTQVLNNIKAEI